MILKWFQSPHLLQVSLLLSHSTCAEFLLSDLYILKSFIFVPDHISVARKCNVINVRVPCLLSRIIMSGLLLGIVLSVCTCWFQTKGNLTS